MLKTVKKMLITILTFQLVVGTFIFSFPAYAEVNRSRELKVVGNKIVLAEDNNVVVRLTGMNIPGAEWTGTPAVERIHRSTKEAMENWDANVIRLPVSVEGWYGEYGYVHDGGANYREYIDQTIKMVSEAGKYVILDLHHYKCFDNPKYLTFWTEAATKYKNNPTVLFGILNEPHSVSWSVWRNGNGSNITGHQQVVEMIRDLGAKNIIVAAGLDWGYDLRGIVGKASGDQTVYALVDQGSNDDLSKKGNGIIYDTHIYPWKGRTGNWDSAVGDVRMQYPIIVGENGWDPDDILAISGKVYYPGDPMYHDQWVPELFAWMNDYETYGNYANWTGWCFHPISSPKILGDKDNWKNDAVYSYPPTEFWGVYVKQELKDNLGQNLVLDKSITSSASDTGYPNTNAVDDNRTTLWKSSVLGNKYLTVDLGEEYEINRWIVRHAGTNPDYSQTLNTKDFKLQVSNDQSSWTDIDLISENTNNITDRFIAPVNARYVRLYVTQAAQTDNILRIHEFSVYGKLPSEQQDPTELPTEVVGNVGQGTISQWYVAQDFKDAVNATLPDGTLDPKTIITPNLASPGNNITWVQNTSRESGFYVIRNTDGINTTRHIVGSRKAQIPIEMTAPSPVSGNGDLVYFDMRLRRVSLSDDPVTLKLMDSSNNEIFNIYFPNNSIPQLVASQTYGAVTSDPALTDVTCPFTEGWVYLRAMIDFDSKTFELYQGATMDTMVPFVEGTTTFTFKNTNASNVNKIYTGTKGSLGFDDVNIYTVSTSGGSPVELPTEVVGNVGQGIIDEWHVYQDFEEAYNESDKVIIVPNLAKSNDYIVWNQNTTRTQNFYSIVNGDAVNTTKYIKGVRKSQIPIEMTIDTHDSSGNPTPSPVTGSGKLVYFDMRMKRVSLSDDPVTLKLMDSSNNEIFNIYFPTNSIPQLVASQTYGAVTSDPALTDVTYPFTEDWVYLRAIIDFDSKTFKLYQGATMDTMVPFVEGTTTFTFKNTNASNVYKFYTGYKGVYAYDDVNVYTVEK